MTNTYSLNEIKDMTSSGELKWESLSHNMFYSKYKINDNMFLKINIYNIDKNPFIIIFLFKKSKILPIKIGEYEGFRVKRISDAVIEKINDVNVVK